MTSQSDIHSLARVLLARSASEGALENPGRTPIDQAIVRTLLGDEFAIEILEPLAHGRVPHDARNLRLTAEDTGWIGRHVPLTPKAKTRINAAQGWGDIFPVLLADERLNETLLRVSAASGKYERLRELAKDIRPVKSAPAAKNAVTVASEPERHPAEAAQVLLDNLHDGLDYATARTRLHALAETRPAELIWLYQQLPVQTGIAPALAYLVRVLAVHTYARFGMYETGYALSSELVDATELAALQADDRARLLKQHAQNALWSGRQAEAVALYRRLVVQYPGDWEYYYLLADNIAHSDPDEARRLMGYALRFDQAPDWVRIFAAGLFDDAEAMGLLIDVLAGDRPHLDVHVGLAALVLKRGDRWAWREHLARYLELQGLSAADVRAEQPGHMFGIGRVETEKRTDHERISVVMTAFNAEKTLAQAVNSVRNQTLANIEILIVDDVSTDGTRAIIEQLVAEDDRIRPVFNTKNVGTYASKNAAIRQATGTFVTFLDSDDWMHPQRLERHLAATQGAAVASMSSMIRLDWSGMPQPRKGAAYMHRNASSTFVRREVFDAIGLFDSVRAGADTEMLWRIRHRYGMGALRELDEVLSLVLYHDASLTTQGAAAWDIFRFSPVRLQYSENFGTWQLDTLLGGQVPFMPFPQTRRVFPAPKGM